MNRKKKKLSSKQNQSSHPYKLCGWCGKPIQSGDESDCVYEIDVAYEHLPFVTGYVHKKHVLLEDHPLFDQMPDIVYTGLPAALEGVYEGF